ncbi:MAG: ATP-binding protein [Candidatus Kapaibacterium sp.]
MRKKNEIEAVLDIDENWKHFLDSIQLFTHQRKATERISELINQGLYVFLELPEARSATLYLLNEDSFDLEFRAIFPPHYKEESEQDFENMLNAGHIGKTLESGSVSILNESESNSINHVAIPLIVSWGVMGLVLIKMNKPIQELPQMNIWLISLHSSLFASSLENHILFGNLKKTKELLAQKIALKTMDLTQSQRELKAIIDSIQAGLLIIDANTDKIIKSNPVATEMTGHEENSIINQDYRLFLDEYKIDPVKTGDLSKPVKFESVIHTATGEKIPILRTVALTNLGLKKFRIESFLDITDRIKAEKELKKSNELLEIRVQEKTIDLHLLIHKLKDEIRERENAQKELISLLEREKELNELKTRFVSMISHEFRTPLTIIKSSAQILDKFGVNLDYKEQKDYLEKIKTTVDYITDLIENVIFIGKAGSDKLDTKPIIIDIRKFAENIINDIRLTLNKERRFEINISGDLEKIQLDDRLLRLILVNLISNAVKYSNDDSTVELEIIGTIDELKFHVKDRGIGIPEKDQKKIFEMFYRAENVGSVTGTGLGMAVVLQSVQLMKGNINLQSKTNEGTVFTITLPKRLK